jgi:uncharacterized protein involved in high-affinity Fe2+ transport
MKSPVKGFMALLVFALLCLPSCSQEKVLVFPIGTPQTKNGMEIAAVYLPAVDMESEEGSDAMLPVNKSDIHLEAFITATEDDPHGFRAGQWIPKLTIEYTLIKLGARERIEGRLIPMVASGGPHYGNNIKMRGIGKYKLILKIDKSPDRGLGGEAQRKNPEGPSPEPLIVTYEFTYFGVGKSGGY